MSKALKAKDPDILPAVMPSDGWFQDEAALTVVGQSDPEFFNKVRYQKGAWNTPSYVSGLRDYKKLYDDGVFDKATLDMDYATAMNAFDSARPPLPSTGSWEAGRILTGDYEIISFPAPTANRLRSAVSGRHLGHSDQSEHQDAAAKFVQYMAAGEGVRRPGHSAQGCAALKDYTLQEGTLRPTCRRRAMPRWSSSSTTRTATGTTWAPSLTPWVRTCFRC